MLQTTLDISKVDFSDSREVCDFVSSLCRTAGNLGMAMPGFKPTRETNEIKQLAIKIVNNLDNVMPRMTVADAFRVLPAYDLAYRFGYMTEPSAKTIDRYTLAAFDSMLRGNKEIDQYAMYRAIAQGLRRRDAAYFDKPLTWLTTVEGQWYTESKQGFDTTALPTYDIHNRVSILLSADLMAYEGRNQSTYKQSLLTRYHPYLNLSDHNSVGTFQTTSFS